VSNRLLCDKIFHYYNTESKLCNNCIKWNFPAILR